MKNVVTYINTGNIIFTQDGLSKSELSGALEEVIYTDFGFQIRVIVRSLNDIRNIIQAIPDSWKNDKEMKSDVMFLWDEVDNQSVLEQLFIKPDVDTVKYVPGAILWSIDKKKLTKSGISKIISGISKIIGTKLYKLVTVRNVNTARKIYELMQAQNSE